jgi:pantetheine-phosphate adenylyltransferase
MKTALYPGTFDPITNGHIDLIERGLKIADQVVVAVAEYSGKSTVLSMEERVAIIEEVFRDNDRVEVGSISGLLVDYARETGATMVLRGLRAVSDFEHEFQMALINRKLYPPMETIFMMPRLRYTFLSSSAVKELAALGGSVTDLVPATVEKELKKRIPELKLLLKAAPRDAETNKP